jgi:signal transduction histidine kinase
MSNETRAACDAVAKRAAELSADATPESLKTIAEAVAQVHFGPDGGDFKYDYHNTHHDDRHRSGAGFGAA